MAKDKSWVDAWLKLGKKTYEPDPKPVKKKSGGKPKRGS